MLYSMSLAPVIALLLKLVFLCLSLEDWVEENQIDLDDNILVVVWKEVLIGNRHFSAGEIWYSTIQDKTENIQFHT